MSNDVGIARTILTTTANAIVRAQASGLDTSVTMTGTPAVATPDPTPTPTPPPSPTPAPPTSPLTVQLLVTTALAGNATAFSLATQGIRTAVWTFGDGATVTTSVPSTTHVYAAGSYTAGVTVTDVIGRTASTTASVTIVDAPPPPPPPPTPNPTLVTTMGCVPGTHATTATACNLSFTYGGAALPSNQITSATWDWGDGTIQPVANSPLGSHTYTQAGSYLVSVAVMVTTTDGVRQGNATKTVIVP
jgi:PKD repeat protein